ncbi:SAM-dependent methyltransferase [Rosistilla oblonga]|uniref:SAM-dependent methyltransferase n=1 Tax=Rosistilla oblonga TaxID=2527990 RepID=UPI003A97EC35
MGQTEAIDPATDESTLQSFFGFVTRKAEAGWLPDPLLRAGIRRLLRSRLRDLHTLSDDSDCEAFLRATRPQPIAVVPEKANDQHYEVPAAFFREVLGPRLKYSCCRWTEGILSLQQAEEQALRETCENAQLEDGMSILELGCGWGSLSLWMAEHYPNSQITAVSNSHSQREFITARARNAGLTNLQVLTVDINHFQPDDSFDRVVSVEMFEHMRNHRKLMDRIHDWLVPDGKLFVHIFCHKRTPYLFRSDGEQNWMGRYFFTGGMMPSENLLESVGSRLTLASKSRWSGMHYAKTSRAWLENHDRCSESLLPILKQTYGEDQAIMWQNRWRMFFMACEELFAFNGGNEWFVSHYLFER